MSKRERGENRRVVVSGFGSNITSDSIAAVFTPYGKVEGIRFKGRKCCTVQFEESESVLKAIQLHGSRQPLLNTTQLNVTPIDPLPVKKSKVYAGSFVVLDPPRFNNFLIPVLPSFMSSGFK
ncbi:unnamed protein product [Blepharisma stoltei]|uniref:RRM domain-containing protein n=1 Tax=Blepharisma stoltei TaxID=1481888 RepID=A0AAU9JJ76_9CILI|nr:unnamed protein product [Blepharisma stoltei]